MKSRSGQALMIGVLLLLLMAIIIPVVFMNMNTSRHGIFSTKKNKGRVIAEEGAAFAMQQLSQPGNWPYFTGGTMPTAGIVKGADGNYFQVTYTSAPSSGLQTYQVGIVSLPIDPSDTSHTRVIPGSSVKMLVSQKTTGVKLPTGLNAGAALELSQVPSNNGTLRVEFGPIVVRDTNTWTLDSYSTTSGNKRPRKFSPGGISPRNTTSFPPPTSDQREYWTFASPGFASVMNANAYITAAQGTNCPAPSSCPGCGTASGRAAGDSTSCYFSNVTPGTATFNNGAYTSNVANGAIYINGNAEFDNFTVDMASGGVYVAGRVVLGNNNAACSGGSCPNSGYATVTNVRVPPTFVAEDPYCTCTDWACAAGQVDRHIDFKGFLYSAGNLIVSSGYNWTVAGVVRSDGQLQIQPNATLDIFYNDVINHQIKTTNFDLLVDSSTALP